MAEARIDTIKINVAHFLDGHSEFERLNVAEEGFSEAAREAVGSHIDSGELTKVSAVRISKLISAIRDYRDRQTTVRHRNSNQKNSDGKLGEVHTQNDKNHLSQPLGSSNINLGEQVQDVEPTEEHEEDTTRKWVFFDNGTPQTEHTTSSVEAIKSIFRALVVVDETPLLSPPTYQTANSVASSESTTTKPDQLPVEDRTVEKNVDAWVTFQEIHLVLGVSRDCAIETLKRCGREGMFDGREDLMCDTKGRRGHPSKLYAPELIELIRDKII